MTIPTPDEICEDISFLRHTANCELFHPERAKQLNRIADLIQQQQADIERLSALVEESLYHLRLDEAAKAYHERALTALGKDASDEHCQKG